MYLCIFWVQILLWVAALLDVSYIAEVHRSLLAEQYVTDFWNFSNMVYIYTIPLPKISIHIKSRLDNIYPSSSGIVIFFLLLFLLFIIAFMQGICNK